jgi:xanthine dehydrogenase small subunit
MTVLEYLRRVEHRIGTKEGCAEGDCGACTVVVARPRGEKLRYEAINACIRFLPTLDGCQLLTVEDLKGPDGRLHPVQQAMVDANASQCGFCTPGFVMSLYALYRGGATPDDATIDARRTGDLQRLTDALAVYVKRHGDYPSTHNAIMQVCGSDTDAGCALKAVAPDLIFSDAGDPYYYASDGNRYVLISRAKATSDAGACPVGLPAELVAGPVICRSGEAKN